MKLKGWCLSVFCVVLLSSLPVYGEEGAQSDDDLWQRDCLSEGLFGLTDSLEDHGVKVEVFLTQVYQQNVHGGLSTHRRAGRYAGTYDFEWTFDMEKLLGIQGGELFVCAEGSWSEGISGPAVGGVFPVNTDAAPECAIFVSECFWDQRLFDDKLFFRVGKIDLKGKCSCNKNRVAFDGNNFANKKTRNFFNKGLYVNRSIPTPDNGIGAIVMVKPVESFYLAGGFSDAQANEYETTFNTSSHEEDYFLYMGEVGFMPKFTNDEKELPGTYRFGFWYDPQEKDHYDGSGCKRDDLGFYLSFDQLMMKENSNGEDRQGLGAFARYGWADDEVNKMSNFWSFGAQYQGLLGGRDEDVLAFGIVQGVLSDEMGSGFTEEAETVYELYYRIAVAPWLEITPDIQYITDPGGNDMGDDALIMGVRFQMAL